MCEEIQDWSDTRQAYETDAADSCSCHINPPCDWCIGMDEDEFDVYAKDGLDGLRRLWAARDDAHDSDTEQPTPPPKPKRPRKSGPCQTDGCGRIATSGNRYCRTCRAEAPLRAELAQVDAAHKREVEAYRGELGAIKRHLSSVGIHGASVVHAARLAGERVAGLTADLETVTAHRDRLLADWRREDERARRLDSLLEEMESERDALERERDGLASTYRGLTAANAQMVRERDDWRAVAQAHALDRDRTRGEVAHLTRRLRLLWAAVAVLAGLAVLGLGGAL